MQLGLTTSASFVDLLDGYTYLPSLSDRMLIDSKDEYTPQNISVMLHEFTHQWMLSRLLGSVPAYYNAVTFIGKMIAGFEAESKLSPLLSGLSDDERTCRIDGLATEYFWTWHAAGLGCFRNFIAETRWLFEGLAMFAQLEYTPSPRFEPAAPHFLFLLTLLRTGHSSKSDSEPQTAVTALCESARMYGLDSGLKWRLLANNSPNTTAYFAGYLQLKEIQKRLAALDLRLADPELFLIFILGFFSNDARLVSLCRVTDGFKLMYAIRNHFKMSLDVLVGADPQSLRALIDRIVNFTDFETNYYEIDYFAGLTTGTIANVDRPAAELQALANLRMDCEDEAWGLEIMNKQRSDAVVPRVLQASYNLFALLKNHYNFFKLRHSQRIVVGCGECSVLTITTSGSFAALESLPADRFALLKRQIEVETLDLIDLTKLDPNDPNMLPNAVTRGLNAQWPCILDEYDACDLMSMERFRLLVRKDFIRLDNLTARDQPLLNARYIENIGSLFKRAAYWAAVSVNVPAGQGYEKWLVPDATEEVEAISSLWPVTFPIESASALKRFLSMKLGLCATDKRAWEMMRTLCYGKVIPLASNDKSGSDAIAVNRRWSQFVGSPLITEMRVGDMAPLALTL